VDTPEVIVREFEGVRPFERGDADALGIHLVEDAADCAVFTARVHRLKDDEETLFAFGVDECLEFVDLAGELLHEFFAFFFIDGKKALVGRGNRREVDFRGGLDAERVVLK